MKVFIGWSGERSRAVAQALREWIPNVIQAVNPWMSEQDATKGSSWIPELVTQLDQAAFGIICVTPENREAPWLAFEAGALKVRERPVCPFLLGLEATDLQGPGPLTLFQSVKAEREDTLHMMRDVNQALGDMSLPNDLLKKQFDRCWPDLEKSLAEARSLVDSPLTKREVREMVEEILEIVRSEARERGSFSRSRDDSVSYATDLLRASLGDLPNPPPEIRRALKLLRPAVRNVPYFRRKHRPEGKIVSARANALSDGKWRAEVLEPEGEDRLMEWFFDCETKQIAETTADGLVQEGYPHSCGEEKCDPWGAVLVRGGKARSE